MRVSTAIDLLSKYHPSDELFITWWDKESSENFLDDPISDETWTYVVESLDEDEWFTSGITDTIIDLVANYEEEDV